jgi:hypothetical protein
VANHASVCAAVLSILGMNYVDSVKILLVLKSYLIQNSWTQIVDVLVLKVL